MTDRYNSPITKGIVAFVFCMTFAPIQGAEPQFSMLACSNSPGDRQLSLISSDQTISRIWPAPDIREKYGHGVISAQFSEDASRIAAFLNLDSLLIVNRDGSNPEIIKLPVPFRVSGKAFAWTSNGIFWYDKQTQYLYRYVPQAQQFSTVAHIEDVPNTTSFGGIYASRDGSRMFSWLTMDHLPEVGKPGYDSTSKPFIYFDGLDFSRPTIRYAKFWGHGNMLLPDGSRSLHVGWKNGEKITHPYIKSWNWDLFKKDTTYATGLEESGPLVQVANSSDWIGVAGGKYLWNISAPPPGKPLQPTGVSVDDVAITHCWLGVFPEFVSSWSLSTSAVSLYPEADSVSISLNGWSYAEMPSVSSESDWLETTIKKKSESRFELHLHSTQTPAAMDTAIVIVNDSKNRTRKVVVYWFPKQPLTVHLNLKTEIVDDAVKLMWSPPHEGSYEFTIQKYSRMEWTSPAAAESSWIDSEPVEGINRYRITALNSTDTLSEELEAYYTATESITMIYPQNGAWVRPGEEITIRWSATRIPTVLLEYSSDYGATFNLITTDGGINKGTPEWANIPFVIPAEATRDLFIRVRPYESHEPAGMVKVVVSDTLSVRRPVHGGKRDQSSAIRSMYDTRGRRIEPARRSPAVQITIIAGDDPQNRKGFSKIMLKGEDAGRSNGPGYNYSAQTK